MLLVNDPCRPSTQSVEHTCCHGVSVHDCFLHKVCSVCACVRACVCMTLLSTYVVTSVCWC